MSLVSPVDERVANEYTTTMSSGIAKNRMRYAHDGSAIRTPRRASARSASDSGGVSGTDE